MRSKSNAFSGILLSYLSINPMLYLMRPDTYPVKKFNFVGRKKVWMSTSNVTLINKYVKCLYDTYWKLFKLVDTFQNKLQFIDYTYNLDLLIR